MPEPTFDELAADVARRLGIEPWRQGLDFADADYFTQVIPADKYPESEADFAVRVLDDMHRRGYPFELRHAANYTASFEGEEVYWTHETFATAVLLAASRALGGGER